MYILGISAFFHDSAACLLHDGRIVAAAQEERFTRIKHDAGFPTRAIAYCLDAAGITMDEIDHVGFYEKPLLKFDRILRTGASFYPKGLDTFFDALGIWAKKKLWTPGFLRDSLIKLSPSRGTAMRWDKRLAFSEHHHSHAASAFYPSPFDEAAILVVDGVGEWSTVSLGHGDLDKRGVPRIRFLREIHYPQSLGMLYSAFTYYLGFKVNSGEYKVMGLAPYGTPRYAGLIKEHLIDIRDDGSFDLNFDHFSYPYNRVMVKNTFGDLFGLPPRTPESPLTEQHFDIAASLQNVTEDVMLGLGRHAAALIGSPRLCMAGGVALNCVANGRLYRDGAFKDIWIQPAAGDAGNAIGAAFYVWHDMLKRRRNRVVGPRPADKPERSRDMMHGSYLGPSFSTKEICAALDTKGLAYTIMTESERYDKVADLLNHEMVIGWFQGRMEFGPRALGNRSIIATPCSVTMQKVLNLKIKYRESFRPFAPAVLLERVQDWFEFEGKTEDSLLATEQGGYASPYMLLVADVRKQRRLRSEQEIASLQGLERLNMIRSTIPSCTHVDFSARIQTVSDEDNPAFYRLISAFERLSNVPILVNTSFNIRGEPIVCTPDDAIRCFLGTEMDALVMEGVLVLKQDVPKSMLLDYRGGFSPD